MKQFVFKLDSVLQLRNQEERKVVDAHAQALRKVHELNEAMSHLNAGLQSEHQRYQASLAKPHSVSQMKTLRAGCDYYEQRLYETKKQLELAEVKLAEQQDALTAARREREVMERYRDRLAGVHAQSIAKADQIFLDELSLRGAGQPS